MPHYRENEYDQFGGYLDKENNRQSSFYNGQIISDENPANQNSTNFEVFKGQPNKQLNNKLFTENGKKKSGLANRIDSSS